MKHLIHPTYIPNIVTFAVIAQKEVYWEYMDNYQKQTYRNRAYVSADRGKHILNIPIIHSNKEKGKQKYKDIKIDNSYPWQRQHWRTLETAYRSSPFFEFYEDEIQPLYSTKFESLLVYNLKTIEVICECLQIDIPKEKTTEYTSKLEQDIDLRFLVNAKKEPDYTAKKYIQVFSDRNNFIPNISILDLLFNEGTNSLTYLKDIQLDFLNV
ncbi:WbqC-like protein [Maribacter vaceletii]|uniref:WbqC-like protein n=1 Tax=Maribacter vaceletii TaxID=1206816 RepID=A0A495DSL2_9FLAO|nr:WbqC family protein [Maribacter vaceletii]RKR07126.1 WbqC-like protein [Maribacter vaceletii]